MQPDLGPFGGAQRLGDRLDRAGVAFSRVGGVECAAPPDLSAKAGDFVFRGADFRCVFETGGIAECAFVEPFAEQARHALQSVGVSRTVAQAECGEAKLAVRHQGQHVDRRTGGGEPVEIAAEPVQRSGTEPSKP